jgi:hypothetical protein
MPVPTGIERRRWPLRASKIRAIPPFAAVTTYCPDASYTAARTAPPPPGRMRTPAVATSPARSARSTIASFGRTL